MTDKTNDLPESKPVAPRAETVDARVDSLMSWVEEQIALDNVPWDVATRRALKAALSDPTVQSRGDRKANPVATKIVGWLILLIIAAILIPGLLWIVGNGVVPLWEWSLSWIR